MRCCPICEGEGCYGWNRYGECDGTGDPRPYSGAYWLGMLGFALAPPAWYARGKIDGVAEERAQILAFVKAQ